MTNEEMETFPSRPEYERLFYSLPQVYPDISTSTLRFYTTTATTCRTYSTIGSQLLESALHRQPCLR